MGICDGYNERERAGGGGGETWEILQKYESILPSATKLCSALSPMVNRPKKGKGVGIDD